jgi:hypothetical protein
LTFLELDTGPCHKVSILSVASHLNHDIDLDLQEIAKKELESLQEQSSSTREEMGDLEAKAANLQEPLE